MKNQRKFMDWAAKQLNVAEMTDWYQISSQVKIKNEKCANYRTYEISEVELC
jgi:hypothetical protein